MNHYQVLGLSLFASSDEIRKAYRSLARQFHPDLNPGVGAEDKFKKITQAYEVLGDAGKKEQYDRQLRNEEARKKRSEFKTYQQQAEKVRKEQARRQQQQYSRRASSTPKAPKQEVPDITKIIKDIASKISQPIRSLLQKKGRGVAVSIAEVIVTVPESVKGAKKTVDLEGRRIQLEVPAGVRSGSVIRLRNKHTPSEDLIVVVRIAPHPYLSIHPRGLVAEIPVSLKEVVEGSKIRVPTLDSEVLVQIPRGTQSGREICLKGKGIRNKDGSRGDLFLKLIVQIPTGKEFVDLARRAEKMYGGSVRARLGTRLVK